MYLKSIEMQGFKSFADKTKVEFDRGVTAVVGPNGSGKSNITESLRWALGESSAKSLRGGKMPDVIFAGTQGRAALNFAEVTVTLDNADQFIKEAGEELRVTRRIYRNGDSEYLIDGRKVRLRDIHDLFMDTGLGRDSFSIISQGRVEEIFNSKAADRRAIFEEAAGVLKYKTRKKETETKLNQTQDNLNRLEDIIYELETRIDPLEKQMVKAKEFLRLDEDRRALALDLLVETIHCHQKALAKEETEAEGLAKQLASYYQSREKYEQKNGRLKQKRHQLQDANQQRQSDLLHLTQLMSNLEKELEIKQMESKQSESRRQEAEAQLEGLEQDVQDLKAVIQTKETGLLDRQDQLAEKVTRLTGLKKELANLSQNPDQVIEQLREQYVQVMQEEADASNTLTQIDKDMERLNQEMANQSQEMVQMESDLATCRQEAKEQLDLTEASHQKVKDLLETYQAKMSEKNQAEQDYQGLQNQYYAFLDEQKNKRARLSSLETIQKNHSNFYAGVKAVLQASDQIGGIIGAVSEQLSFDRRYQTAMEIILSAAGQQIIVEDELAAKRSIQYLKEKRAGRATFLPLTTIKERHLADNLLQTVSQSVGFIGQASQLVSYEPRLKGIMENLLATTVVFDHVDNANQAARACQFKVRIVTLDGTEIRAGGAFSGGSNRQNNSLFIKPEIDELQEAIKVMDGQLKTLEPEISVKKEQLDQLNQDLANIKESGDQARLEEQAADLRYQQLAERLNDLEALVKLARPEASQQQIEQLAQRKIEVEKGLIHCSEEKERLNQEIEAIKKDKDSLQERLTALRQKQSDLQLEERDLENNIRFEQQELKRLRGDLVNLMNQVESLRQVLEVGDQPVTEADLEQLRSQLEQAKTKRQAVESDQIRDQFELEDIDAQLEEVEEALLRSQKENESLIREQSQLESSMDRHKDQLRQAARQLAEEHEMNFEKAKTVARELEHPNLAEEELKTLEKAIRALGPINLDAIEEYEEVHQRLAFLMTQKEDLDEAKALLLDTIKEMDDEVSQRFKTTFEAIRESFKITFKRMFGGGTADLTLTDSNLLEAGIEISVQPPGKKIQSLNLMSGGEKALSALALLFAIIRVKTIPFVILDEVEAALDEANVKRFGDYLNQFDQSSQFIVVTHRKGTMAAADSIYGVTMQESGVSRILSVKLKEANELVR